jgi:hypothetical protein
VEGRRIAFWRAPISERGSENLSRTKCRGLSDHGSEQASEGTYARDGQLWRELSLVVMGMKQLHNTSLALLQCESLGKEGAPGTPLFGVRSHRLTDSERVMHPRKYKRSVGRRYVLTTARLCLQYSRPRHSPRRRSSSMLAPPYWRQHGQRMPTCQSHHLMLP